MCWVLGEAGRVEHLLLNLWLVTRHDCLSRVEAALDCVLCLLQPAEVDMEAVLQEEDMAGSVEEDEGFLRFGVEGAVAILEALYQEGTLSLSILACIRF